jgi:eukaryotic-like serine/threonine-protein kinase
VRVDGAFKQDVALKLLHAEFASSESQHLLQRERGLLARLNHPGLARIIDGGESADGQLWFAMELVDGLRIDRYCQRQQLARSARLKLLLQVIQTVAYAHEQLLIHRDIKASNILVDALGKTRLLDFGIAGTLSDEHEIVDPTRRMMTPAVASPEQKQGLNVSTASDIFQLGKLLQSLMQDILRTNHDRALDEIAQKATAQDQMQRYRTATELAQDVEAFLTQRPVQAMQGGAMYKCQLFVRRHLVAVLAVLSLFTLALITTTLFLTRLQAARQAAEIAATQARQEAAKAGAVRDFLINLFESANPQRQRGQKLDLATLLDTGAADLRAAKDLDVATQRELQLVMARVFLAIGRRDRAAAVISSLDANPRTIDDADPLMRAEHMRLSALTLSGPDAPTRSAQLLQSALALLDVAQPKFFAQRALIGHDLAIAQFQSGQREAGIVTLQQVISALAKDPDAAGVQRAKMNLTLGQFFAVVGRGDEAMAALSSAFDVLQRDYGADYPDTIIAAGALGMLRFSAGDKLGAYALLQQAISSTEHVHGKKSAQYPLAINALAHTMVLDGRYDEAIAQYQRALAAALQLDPENDLNSVQILEGLGQSYRRLGQLELARQTFERMLARNQNAQHALDPDIGQRPAYLAEVLIALNRCAQARPLLALASTRAAARAPKNHWLFSELPKMQARCSDQ